MRNLKKNVKMCRIQKAMRWKKTKKVVQKIQEVDREYQTKNCEHEENLKRETEFFIIAAHNRCIRAVSK